MHYLLLNQNQAQEDGTQTDQQSRLIIMITFSGFWKANIAIFKKFLVNSNLIII